MNLVIVYLESMKQQPIVQPIAMSSVSRSPGDMNAQVVLRVERVGKAQGFVDTQCWHNSVAK